MLGANILSTLSCMSIICMNLDTSAIMNKINVGLHAFFQSCYIQPNNSKAVAVCFRIVDFGYSYIFVDFTCTVWERNQQEESRNAFTMKLVGQETMCARGIHYCE